MINNSPLSNINAAEITERLKNGEDMHLLDVREPIEYLTYNIGGKNIPLGKLADNLSKLEWNKEDEIIVICKIGLRSETAQAILTQNGYTNIRNLEGGLVGLLKAER